MHHAKSAAVVAALAGMSAATPVDIRGRSSFRVDQIAVPRTVNLTPAQRTLNTYAKYGKVDAAPANVVNAATSQSGAVTANSEDGDEEYVCSVLVGADTLNLDFDTGSSDLWVFSTLTPKSESSGHNLYNPSTGSKEKGETWSISYGDGSGASGVVYADKVVVGSVTATSQAVEAATSVSSEFVSDTSSDGLLGLGFSSINTASPKQVTTFFDTVKSTLALQLFTARLRHNAPGSYDFGKIDSSLYTGSIGYVPVDNSEGYWGFTAGTYTINGKTSSGTIGSSIADTGTTLLYVPDSVVDAYYAQVPTSENSNTYGGYVFDCSESPPDFTVQIGSGSYTVPGSYINFAANGDGTCFGGIQSSDGIGLNIFGDIFLKAQFVVFDETQSSPRLGFATGA